MNGIRRSGALACLALAAVIGAAAGQSGAGAKAGKPQITVTVTPRWGRGGVEEMAEIAGSVQGAPKDARLVLFTHTDFWYVQPWAASPFTKLTDGVFRTRVHLGSEYAVLLVRLPYSPSATWKDVPAEGGDVLALKVVPAR